MEGVYKCNYLNSVAVYIGLFYIKTVKHGGKFKFEEAWMVAFGLFGGANAMIEDVFAISEHLHNYRVHRDAYNFASICWVLFKDLIFVTLFYDTGAIFDQLWKSW